MLNPENKISKLCSLIQLVTDSHGSAGSKVKITK